MRSAVEQSLNDEGERLYRALGEFFLLWADTELELYRTLLRYCGINDDIGRALFSGSRSRAMIDFIKNIAHNTRMEKVLDDDLTYLFAQINAINTVRDRFAHHGSASNYSVEHPSMKRALSNYHRVGKKGTEFNAAFNSSTIQSINSDLRDLQSRLRIHCHQDAVKLLQGQALSGPPRAWRYTPEQPSSPKNKTREAPLKQRSRK
jgi:hypothetical protein